MGSERVRLADLLAAVSVATDLGMGQEPEKAIRACLVATALARRMGAPEADISHVYYTALLRHLGCTATAHEEAWLGGDELVSRPVAERADFGNPREALGLLLQMGKGTGPTGCGTSAAPSARGSRSSTTNSSSTASRSVTTLGSCVIASITSQELAVNCSLVIRLPDGNLTGQFVAIAGPAPREIALTGGTGRFRAAGGEGILVEFGNGEGRMTLQVLSLVARGTGA